jgi:hypothetical protein
MTPNALQPYAMKKLCDITIVVCKVADLRGAKRGSLWQVAPDVPVVAGKDRLNWKAYRLVRLDDGRVMVMNEAAFLRGFARAARVVSDRRWARALSGRGARK